MKTLEFNRQSWHYRIATVYGNLRPWEDNTDLCSYTQSVMLGFVSLVLIIAFSVAFLFPISDLIMGLVFSIVYGTWIMSQIGAFTIFFIAVFTVGFSIVILVNMIAEFGNGVSSIARNKDSTNHGFIVHAYKSFTEKYCVGVSISDKGNK